MLSIQNEYISWKLVLDEIFIILYPVARGGGGVEVWNKNGLAGKFLKN